MTLSLRTFSTLKIGGTAERIIRLKDLNLFSEDLPRPIRILGNGSNVLIDDRGLKGTVLVLRDFSLAEPEVLSSESDSSLVRVSAGMFLPSLCRWAQRLTLSGCEYMIGVPGTVGGAVVQNAEANHQEMRSLVERVRIYNFESKKMEEWTKEQCQFVYRGSALRERKDILVLSADLRLFKGRSDAIEKQIELNLQYRREKTPYAKPSLGSTWTRLPLNDGTWIYPGKIIEESGLKGLRVGSVRISDVHANYIVNEGDGTFTDAYRLIHEVERRVYEKTGVKLRREILIWSDREV